MAYPTAGMKRGGDQMPKSIFSQLVVVIASLAVAFWGTRVLAETVTIQDDPRPVAKAVEQLNHGYGWQITYEDRPYKNNSDLMDVTQLVQRYQGGTAETTKTLIPKGGTVSFTLPSTNSDQLTAAQALVNSYNDGRGANLFAVVRGAKLVHIVPIKVTGSSGTLEPVKPILDTIITVTPQERTALQLLEQICQAISIDTKNKVVVGTNPSNLLMQARTSIGATNKTARSLLETLILQIGAPLSWELFYDAGLKWYVLNFDLMRPVKKQ